MLKLFRDCLQKSNRMSINHFKRFSFSFLLLMVCANKVLMYIINKKIYDGNMKQRRKANQCILKIWFMLSITKIILLHLGEEYCNSHSFEIEIMWYKKLKKETRWQKMKAFSRDYRVLQSVINVTHMQKSWTKWKSCVKRSAQALHIQICWASILQETMPISIKWNHKILYLVLYILYRVP